MPQPTVTPTETDTRWSITPQGRARDLLRGADEADAFTGQVTR